MEPGIKANDKTEARRVVLRETFKIAVGEAVCVALMVAVFALLGHWDRSVLLGGIAGGVLAILNFFFMALGASQAMDRAVQQDVKGGKKQIRMNYGLRMIVLFVILFALVKSGACDALASVLPLFFVRITITVAEFFRK